MTSIKMWNAWIFIKNNSSSVINNLINDLLSKSTIMKDVQNSENNL